MSLQLLQGAMQLAQQGRANRSQELQTVQAIRGARSERSRMQMAQKDLGIRLAKHNTQQLDANKRASIDQGLAEAVKVGGYSEGIEYLKGVDPNRAIAFHAKKLDLDNRILKNDVMQSVAPLEKQKAMFESYGTLGKMSVGIMGLPADQQAKAYKMMLPAFKKIDPGLPDEYTADAQIALQLYQAQGTPENILYSTSKNQITARSKLAKIGQDIDSRVAMGLSPETDPTLKALVAEQKGLQQKAEAGSLQLLETQMKMAKTQQQATESFNKTLNSESSDFRKAFDSYTQVKSHIDALKENPQNTYSQSVIQRMFIKSINQGAMSIADEALGDAATGMAGLNKKMRSMVTGQKVNLNDSEIAALTGAWENTMKGKLKAQAALEARFKESGQNYKNVQWKAVRFPSEDYYNFLDPQRRNRQALLTQLPEAARAQAMEALEQVKGDPEATKRVMGNIQQVLQQGQQNAQ